MLLFWIVAFIAGLAGVLQSGVTRKLAPTMSLAIALHVSNLVVLIGGVIAFTIISLTMRGEIAELLRAARDWNWSWWVLFPGLMGLFVITVLPIAILRLGALPVFVAMVFGQVLTSGIWDYMMEDTPFDKWRWIGCVLTLSGAYAISLSKS